MNVTIGQRVRATFSNDPSDDVHGIVKSMFVDDHGDVWVKIEVDEDVGEYRAGDELPVPAEQLLNPTR